MMVALSTMDELTKANTGVEVIRSQVKEYVDEAGKARMERDAALREIDVLKAKIEQLENLLKLKSLKERIDADQAAAAEAEEASAKPDEEQLTLTEETSAAEA